MPEIRGMNSILQRLLLFALALAILCMITPSMQAAFPTTQCTAYFGGPNDPLQYDLVGNNDFLIKGKNIDCDDKSSEFTVRGFAGNAFIGEYRGVIGKGESESFWFYDLDPGEYSFRLYFSTGEHEALMDVAEGIKVSWCGDGICGNQRLNENEENCWSCQEDCACADFEACDRFEEMCMPFCGNDMIDGNETCQNCPEDAGCGPGQICKGDDGLELCEDTCGNGVCQAQFGEDCWSCQEDCGCTLGGCNVNQGNIYKYVDTMDEPLPFRAECIGLGTDMDCSFVGNACVEGQFCHNKECADCVLDEDCETRGFLDRFESEEYVCTNNTVSSRVVYESGYKCDWNRCGGSRKILDQATECGEAFCQDGTCGCKEGFSACPAAGECRKDGAIGLGRVCTCDSECDSSFCFEGVCGMKVSAADADKLIAQYGEENVDIHYAGDDTVVTGIPDKKTIDWNAIVKPASWVIVSIALLIILALLGRWIYRRRKGKAWKGDYF